MITTTCPSCRVEVSVPIGSARVVLDPAGAVLALACPACGRLVSKPLIDSFVTALLRHGAVPTPTPLPPPHPEQVTAPDAPPFSEDDVSRAGSLLDGARTVADLVDLMTAEVSPAPGDHAGRGPG